MTQMLLSIKPEFVDSILSNKKRYEFRRSRCRKAIDSIVIYATSPRQQIVGEVEVLDIIEDKIDKVWEATKDHAGLSFDRFVTYYSGKDTATAYVLGKVTTYRKPLSLTDFGISKAPQSFQYLPVTTN